MLKITRRWCIICWRHRTCTWICRLGFRIENFELMVSQQMTANGYLPGVGVRCPVELGLVFIIKCDCGWLMWLIFDVALFIVVIERPAVLCVCAKWWSRGGDTGSDFTFIGIGDVDGGGVLFDTANWVNALQNKAKGQKKTSVGFHRSVRCQCAKVSRIKIKWYLVCCTVLMFGWFQLDMPMTSAELIEKSCGPNEPRLEYARFGVCNATTGVFSDVCCRCCGEYDEIRFLVWKHLSCGMSNGAHTSL